MAESVTLDPTRLLHVCACEKHFDNAASRAGGLLDTALRNSLIVSDFLSYHVGVYPMPPTQESK